MLCIVAAIFSGFAIAPPLLGSAAELAHSDRRARFHELCYFRLHTQLGRTARIYPRLARCYDLRRLVAGSRVVCGLESEGAWWGGRY